MGILFIEDIDMNTQDVIALFDQYVIANYGRLPRVITRGQDNLLYDAEGNEILDMFPGWAVSGIGHCHPKVVKAIQEQAAVGQGDQSLVKQAGFVTAGPQLARSSVSRKRYSASGCASAHCHETAP